jgi:hypothetical protein
MQGYDLLSLTLTLALSQRERVIYFALTSRRRQRERVSYLALTSGMVF